MADKKLSELTELDATPASDDEVYIRDVSEAEASESKRITIANLLPNIKAGVVTETTGADGKIAVEFAAAFASTPVVVATLIGDVDYYPVITARSADGFTVKMLKTAHKHAQGNTGSGGSHSHTQGVTGAPSAYGGIIGLLATGTLYGASTSGGSPTTSFRAIYSTESKNFASQTHTHTNPSTSTAGSHSHTNPDTATVNAGNLLASTEVNFSYIAMIP